MIPLPPASISAAIAAVALLCTGLSSVSRGVTAICCFSTSNSSQSSSTTPNDPYPGRVLLAVVVGGAKRRWPPPPLLHVGSVLPPDVTTASPSTWWRMGRGEAVECDGTPWCSSPAVFFTSVVVVAQGTPEPFLPSRPRSSASGGPRLNPTSSSPDGMDLETPLVSEKRVGINANDPEAGPTHGPSTALSFSALLPSRGSPPAWCNRFLGHSSRGEVKAESGSGGMVMALSTTGVGCGVVQWGATLGFASCAHGVASSKASTGIGIPFTLRSLSPSRGGTPPPPSRQAGSSRLDEDAKHEWLGEATAEGTERSSGDAERERRGAGGGEGGGGRPRSFSRLPRCRARPRALESSTTRPSGADRRVTGWAASNPFCEEGAFWVLPRVVLVFFESVVVVVVVERGRVREMGPALVVVGTALVIVFFFVVVVAEVLVVLARERVGGMGTGSCFFCTCWSTRLVGLLFVFSRTEEEGGGVLVFVGSGIDIIVGFKGGHSIGCCGEEFV